MTKLLSYFFKQLLHIAGRGFLTPPLPHLFYEDPPCIASPFPPPLFFKFCLFCYLIVTLTECLITLHLIYYLLNDIMDLNLSSLVTSNTFLFVLCNRVSNLFRVSRFNTDDKVLTSTLI